MHHIYIHGHCVLGAGCRSKLERNKDRDVSEKIALGLPTGAPSQDSLFDQRLFNQSKVLVSRYLDTQKRSGLAGKLRLFKNGPGVIHVSRECHNTLTIHAIAEKIHRSREYNIYISQ